MCAAEAHLRSRCVCLSSAALSASASSATCSTRRFQTSLLAVLLRTTCIRHVLSICWLMRCSAASFSSSWRVWPDAWP